MNDKKSFLNKKEQEFMSSLQALLVRYNCTLEKVGTEGLFIISNDTTKRVDEIYITSEDLVGALDNKK